MVGRPLLDIYLGVRTAGGTGTVLLDGVSALVPFILYSSRHSSNEGKLPFQPNRTSKEDMLLLRCHSVQLPQRLVTIYGQQLPLSTSP